MSNMSKLAPLRSRLSTLRRQRALVRWGNAYSALIIAILWTLLAAFVIDFGFELGRPERVVLWLAGIAIGFAVYQKFTRPHLGKSESEIDVALLVERQQEIDSDLVAAIQFESGGESARWGSPHLRTAVIDYVADFGSTLDVFKGFSAKRLIRRFSLLGVTAVVLLGLGVAYPDHVRAFFNRMLMGSSHYPTHTIIDSIAINGKKVYPGAATVRAPYGRPLRIEVQWRGRRPDSGRAELLAGTGRLQTTLELKPHGDTSGGPFTAELPRLVDAVVYQVFLGDAWTDPTPIEVIPLPVVALDLRPIPPKYAAGVEATPDPRAGIRQLSVIEGTSVEFRVKSLNKPLKQARLTIGESEYLLDPDDREGLVWKLTGNTPLSHVTDQVRYQVQVRDRDDLELEQPIDGSVRIKADRPPRVGIAVHSVKVLPNAKPNLHYEAADDYGIARIRVHQQVVREDGSMEESTADIADFPAARQPQTSVRAVYTLRLEPLSLVKGDQLKLTLEVIDYRGDDQGKSALSEPVVLQVTDVPGFLASMVESDEQSARRLDAIIQRQLGIGDTQ